MRRLDRLGELERVLVLELRSLLGDSERAMREVVGAGELDREEDMMLVVVVVVVV